MRGRRAWRRMFAGVCSALTAWIAVDALLNSGVVSGDSADPAFFWFWGAPFALASVLFAWLCVTGGSQGSWRRARLGSVGAVLAGALVFAAAFLARWLGGGGVLTGIVEGLRWTPAAAAVGLVFTLWLTARQTPER